jgi:hypothetical protein
MATREGPAEGATAEEVAVDRERGEERVSRTGIVLLAGLLMVGTGLLFYVLLQFWPTTPAEVVVTPGTTTTGRPTTTTAGPTTTTTGGPTTTTGGPTTTTTTEEPEVVLVQRTLPDPSVQLFGWSFAVSREYRLLVIVVLAGALGGMVHALRSLYWYVGNRRLVRSWLLMYPSLPFVGALLALIVYLLIRGGFVTGLGATPDISPYGSAAIAALVGLFSEQASAKLRQVFSTLLAPAEQGTDHVAPNLPDIKQFAPARGPVGTVVRIAGTGFAGASSVEFRGAAASPTTVSDTEITVAVPAGAQPGPIRVVTPRGTAASTAEFTVEAG